MLAATLILAACSSGDSDDGEAEDPVAQTPSPVASAAAPPEQAPLGPLEAYLGYTDEIDTAESIAARVTWRENLTATCMAAQGFEYVPFVPRPDEIEYEEGPIPNTPEYADDYGYGLWRPPASGGFRWERGEDPNDARINALSESGRAAYDDALLGQVISESQDGSIVRDGGCAGAAETPVGEETAYLVAVRRDAQEFLASLWTDSRFAEVDAAWASCMADAGFADRSPDAARQRIEQALLDATADLDGLAPEPAVVQEGFDEERRTAMADLACRDETDWTALHRAIEVELQAEYVNAHLADLEALAGAVG